MVSVPGPDPSVLAWLSAGADKTSLPDGYTAVGDEIVGPDGLPAVLSVPGEVLDSLGATGNSVVAHVPVVLRRKSENIGTAWASVTVAPAGGTPFSFSQWAAVMSAAMWLGADDRFASISVRPTRALKPGDTARFALITMRATGPDDGIEDMIFAAVAAALEAEGQPISQEGSGEDTPLVFQGLSGRL